MRRLLVMRGLLLLPATLLALALPASAETTWSAPVTLSPSGHSARYPQVGIDQSGNAFFVWRRRDGTTDCGGSPGCVRIQVVARSAAGALSSVDTVSPPAQDGDLPQVAVDQSGNAVISWSGDANVAECCAVQARARSAAGTLSPVQIISPVGATLSFPGLAGNANGNAVFAWEGFDGTTDCGGSPCHRIQTRARSSAGALSTTQAVAAPGNWGPDVAIDQSGNAVYVWMHPYYDGVTNCGNERMPPSCWLAQTRTRSAAGVLSAPQTLSAGGQDALYPQVVVDETGNAVFVWYRLDGTTGCGGNPCFRVQARARSADGTLSATQMVSAFGKNSFNPQLAVDQAGNAVFVWEYRDGTGNCGEPLGCARVQTRVRYANGTLSAIQTLSASGQHASQSRVGIDQSGNAVFAWVRPDGTTSCGGSPGCTRVQARVRFTDGTLGAIQTLSAAGGDAVDPQIAVNPSGNAVVVWSRFGGLFHRIQAAVGP